MVSDPLVSDRESPGGGEGSSDIDTVYVYVYVPAFWRAFSRIYINSVYFEQIIVKSTQFEQNWVPRLDQNSCLILVTYGPDYLKNLNI